MRMKNDPSTCSQSGNSTATQSHAIRYREEMTEQDWTSVWPICTPISDEEFDRDYALAMQELESQLMTEEGSYFSKEDNSLTVNYLGEEQENDTEEDVELPYHSRYSEEHIRYHRRKDMLRVRANRIHAGIDAVISEEGNISCGFINRRTKRAQKAIKEMKKTLNAAFETYQNSRTLKQAKRNLFKLERASLRNIQRGKGFIKQARHYSIYCARYNRYLKDKWSKSDISSEFPNDEKDDESKAQGATKLVKKPSKKQPFVSCHSNPRHHMKQFTAVTTKCTTDMPVTVINDNSYHLFTYALGYTGGKL